MYKSLYILRTSKLIKTCLYNWASIEGFYLSDLKSIKRKHFLINLNLTSLYYFNYKITFYDKIVRFLIESPSIDGI